MKKRGLIFDKGRGFALTELTAAAIVIGLLSAFAIPRLHDAIERSRAGESFCYLSSIQSSQERFHVQHGTYAKDLADLELKLPAPRFFAVGTIDAGDTGSFENSWVLTLTREGASDGYGAYTVTFTENGFSDDPTLSTISDRDHSHIRPM